LLILEKDQLQLVQVYQLESKLELVVEVKLLLSMALQQ
jgi:hypothetical protein